MSTLLVTLPSPPRLAAKAPAPDASAAPPEYRYALTNDKRHIAATGTAAPAQWPAAAEVVALVTPPDVTWHRATLPKASGNKLKAALVGVLEEALLDEADTTHLAIAGDWTPGQATWVAGVRKDWLTEQLAQIEAAGVHVDRVVPLWVPDERPAGHVFRPYAQDGTPLASWLAWRDAQGPLAVPLDSASTRHLIASLPADVPVRWTASPECAAAAGRALAATVAALPDDEWALAASRSDWNLRQFDLVARRRRGSALSDAWHQFLTDATWRLARWGLLALVAVQLAGANLWAWQQRHQLSQLKEQQASVLRAALPQVRTFSDPATTMRQQMTLLRARAGQVGEADFEALMQAAQSAWPPGQPPAQGVQFERGVLHLQLLAPWAPAQAQALTTRLQAQGIAAQLAGNRLTLAPWQPTAAALAQFTAARAASASAAATPQSTNPPQPMPSATPSVASDEPDALPANPAAHPPAPLQPVQPLPDRTAQPEPQPADPIEDEGEDEMEPPPQSFGGLER